MASIHKRPRTPYWFAAWRGQGGRLFLRSTKQIERGKAQTVALEFERAAKLAMSGDLTESQVRAVLGHILEKCNTGESLRAPAIKDWLNEWLAAKEASKAASTGERYGQIVREFITHLGDRAERPLTALTARDIQSFLTKRTKAGCGPTTVQLDGKILRTALNLARRQGLISVNVAEAVELPERDSVERGTFNATEIKLLVDTAEGEWKTLILVGYFTGARLADCCKLRWDSIDLANGTMRYTQTKTGKEVTVPLHPDLQTCLEKLASSDKPETFVLPDMADKGSGGRHGLSESFKRIVRKAGLDLQTVQGKGSRKISKRTFHALRHSFTSALANAGVASELRMKLTGHTSAAIHRGYTHHEMEPLRNAVTKLPSLNATPK